MPRRWCRASLVLMNEQFRFHLNDCFHVLLMFFFFQEFVADLLYPSQLQQLLAYLEQNSIIFRRQVSCSKLLLFSPAISRVSQSSNATTNMASDATCNVFSAAALFCVPQPGVIQHYFPSPGGLAALFAATIEA